MRHAINKIIQSPRGNKYKVNIVINDDESHVSIYSLNDEILEIGICNLNYTVERIRKMVNDIELPPLVAELEEWDGKL